VALIACPECQQHISTLALSCPHCGAPQPPTTGHVPQAFDAQQASQPKADNVARHHASEVRFAKGCVVALVIAVGLFILAIASSKSPTSNRSDAKPDRISQRIAAVFACQDRVREALKAPSTASFPSESEANVRDKGSGIAIVISHVDAQNAFGARLRTRWLCEVDVNDWKNPVVQKVVVEK